MASSFKPDKAVGIFLGLAVGDALGTTLEFGPRRPLSNLHTEMTGGGHFRLAPGQWTDDTAMALALGDSLIRNNSLEPLDVLSEWTSWYRTGKYSCTGGCFDIGNATRAALEAFERTPREIPAVPDESLGNGSVMRLAPAVLFARGETEAFTLSERQAALTHGAKASRATAEFGRLVYTTATRGFDSGCISSRLATLHRSMVKSSGYYLDTIEAACWAVATTSSFEDAVIQAVNLGDDADTVGAVAGQLAGAIYGASAIPARWLANLAWRDRIESMAAHLAGI